MGAGIDVVLSPAIDVEVWRKFVFLAPFAGATCVGRTTIGAVREDPLLWRQFMAMVEEAVAVARARGVDLPEGTEAERIELARKLPTEMKSSMLHDLEAGRRLELDWLTGAVVRLGAEAGVPTPVERRGVRVRWHLYGTGLARTRCVPRRTTSRPGIAQRPVRLSAISSRIIGSSMVAGTLNSLPSASFFMVPRRILPERVLGRRRDDGHQLEGGDRADLVADLGDQLLRGSSSGSRSTPALSTTRPSGSSPLSWSATPITAHSATSGCEASTSSIAAGRQAVAGDVDDVVDAAHDVEVAVRVLVAGVAGQVPAGVAGEIGLAVALVGVPERRQAARRQRQADADRAHLAGRQHLARLVQDLHVVAGHRHGRRAGRTGSCSMPIGLAAIAQPVSVCHQWSITGTPSCASAQSSVSGSQRSPARNRVRRRGEVVPADVACPPGPPS